MLNWLPLPDDFATRLHQARDAGSPQEQVRRLTVIAQSRLDFVQTIQVNRAMDQMSPQIRDILPRLRLALLGSTTLEHLVPAIRVAGLRRELWLDLHCGGYGQYRQDILDPASPLHAFAPQTVVLSVAAAHAVTALDPVASAPEVNRHLQDIVAEFVLLWEHARADFGANVIQQTFLNLTEPLFGSFDRLVPASPWRVIERLNDLLADAATGANVALLDIARACARDGRDAWFDSARMLHAKQEIAPQAAAMYGEMLTRIISAQRGASRKCLVMDLDNTLWGGVLGDDGLQGIVLGQGSGTGESYLELQRYALQLKQRGIILAVCSKNDSVIAEQAFTSHPEMLLKRADIAAFVANWDDKARNLIAIAQRLNIGLDSLVFLDDNPVERARVREALPQVAVPELPHDVAGYVRCLAAAGYFEAASFTAEDRQRAEHYAQNAEREALRDSVQSLEEFLRDLQMCVEFAPFTTVDMPRVAQLINKTNQFNPTTRRYTPEQLNEMLAIPGAVSLQLRLRDRFGDNGLVSAILMLPVAGQSGCLHLDTWVMSCRVFGRQLEHEALNLLVERARRAGIGRLLATYTPTPRNGVISDLFRQLGFLPEAHPAQADGSTRWWLDVSQYVPIETHIVREASQP